tara:strand:- start:123 stop:455 length:333 start_codon:yes stop_codon:yes gene_type:complete
MTDPTPPDDPTSLIREGENLALQAHISSITQPIIEEEKKRRLKEFNRLIDQTLAGIDSDGEAERLLKKVRSLPPDREETPTKGGRKRRRARKTKRKKSKRKTKHRKTRRR